MAVFNCPACDYERDVPDELVGRRGRCPKCGTVVGVGNTSSEALSEASLSADGVVIDLDHVTVDGVLRSHLVCDTCGKPIESCEGLVGQCPHCGKPVCMEEDDLDEDVSEDDVDLSDFEGGNEPPWEGENDSFGSEPPQDPTKVSNGRMLRGGLASNVFAGVVAGILGYISALCMGLLVGSQVPDGLFMPFAGAMAIVSAVVGGLLFSLRTRLPFVLAGPESVFCGVLFLYVGALYDSMRGVVPPDAILPTLTAGIMVAGLLTGITLYVLGRMGAGTWVRYTPVQVVGGVVGGVGVYIVLAALTLITSQGDMPHVVLPGLHLANLTVDLSSGPLRWGPPILFGLVLFGLSCFLRSGAWLLIVLGLCLIGGQAAHIWATDPVLAIIFEPFSLPIDPRFLHDSISRLDFWQSVQWHVIIDHAYFIGALLALAFIKVMYQGMQLEVEAEVHEGGSGDFEALGFANVGAAVFAGMPVSFSQGRSMANLANGGRGALSGVMAALVCGGLFLAGSVSVEAIPRFVPEGLLLFFGFSLVRDWMFRCCTSFTRRDDLVLVVVIFVATVLLGVVMGVGFGVAFGALMAFRRYSQEGGVQAEMSGAIYHSNVDRAPAQARLLREVGDHIHIVRLHGFVFLGTMQNLVDTVRERILDQERLDVEYLVIDFGGVSGFASFSNLGFGMLRNLAMEEELNVVFTRVPWELENYLAESGFALNDLEGSFKIFMDLDCALEWCENGLLEEENMTMDDSLSLSSMLAPAFPDPRYAQALVKIMKRLEVSKGDIVFRQGDPSDTMYFVESGALEVDLEKDGRKFRIKKVGPGGVVGEMGIYRSDPRTATVRAVEDGALYLLTRRKLEMAEKKVPRLVTALNRFLIISLADQLGEANRRGRELL